MKVMELVKNLEKIIINDWEFFSKQQEERKDELEDELSQLKKENKLNPETELDIMLKNLGEDMDMYSQLKKFEIIIMLTKKTFENFETTDEIIKTISKIIKEQDKRIAELEEKLAELEKINKKIKDKQ